MKGAFSTEIQDLLSMYQPAGRVYIMDLSSPMDTMRKFQLVSGHYSVRCPSLPSAGRPDGLVFKHLRRGYVML